MNPLDNYPKVRAVLYLIQWVVSGIAGAVGIYFTAMGESPQWYVLTLGILSFVWSYTGITAKQNVKPPVDLV